MVGVENNNKPSSGGVSVKNGGKFKNHIHGDAIIGENEEINAYSETSGISSTCQ